MTEAHRPGAIYWLDHAVVPTDDLERWIRFMHDVVGYTATWGDEAEVAGGIGGPGPQAIFLKAPQGYCHVAAFAQRNPLPARAGLGKGLPRYAFYIRGEDIDEHLRRLDQLNVPHADPVRTSEDGQEGIAIRFQDPDANEFELWAPRYLPDGAMDGASAVKVGNLAGGTFESRDLDRTAGFYTTYCNVDPIRNADVGKDTLSLALLGGGRVAFKQVDQLDVRTGGSTRWAGVHCAYSLRQHEFIPAYHKVWDELPEWEYDQRAQGPHADPGALPARSGMHGSAAGRRWKALYGRGDQIFDWDTNSFHFVGGTSPCPNLARYEGHYMDEYVEEFLAAKASAGAS